MKTYKKVSFLAVLTLVLTASLLFSPSAQAATPTLTLSSASDGDSVQLSVTGQADSNVVFYYTKTGSGLQINYLGKTNSSGSFSTSLSASSYGISGDTIVYVAVDGVKSNELAWPYLAAESVLSLSQTSVVLPLGQSTTLTVYNNGTNFVYLSSNSNPPAVNVNIDGNKVALKALNFGSTVVTVCAGTGTPSCASAYVTVQNTGGTALAFSQNNPTVAKSKSLEIAVVGGSGAYILLNNVNANIIQASLSASTVTLSTTASSGSSAITICSSDMSSCGIINAIVGNVSSSGLTFGITNPTMTIGQNLYVPISGGTSGSYSVFSNTDTDVVTASVSDTDLILVAREGGAATVTVCSNAGNCAPLVVTVSFNSTTGGALTLSQNNLWLMVGQSASITVTGGAMPYSAVGYSESIIKASFNNNILNITGVGGGSATVNVCSKGGCVGLAVLVSGSSSSETSALTLSQSSLTLKTGASVTVGISGNGNYFVAYNTSPEVALATISGTLVAVNALAVGTTDVSVCQNGGQCSVLKITVSGDTAITLSQSKLTLNVGNTARVLITGSGGYSLSQNSNAGVASAVVSDSAVTITALSSGQTNMSICQSGGQCASVAVTVTGASTAATDLNWTFCSDEKGTCSFTGYQTIRYGANGKYHYGSYLNGVSCSNSIFGDPIENVVKQCYYGGVIPEESGTTGEVAGEKIAGETEAGWTSCANEKQICQFSGSQTVRYGANGKYYYGTYTNSVGCNNSVFGDPIENVVKQCSYGGTMPAQTGADSGWTACADEKGTCKFSGVKTVRYGANGKYYYGIYDGSAPCLNSVFGDPAENVVKQCSYGGEIPADASAAPYKFQNSLVYGSSGDEVKELQKRLVAEGFFTEAIDGKFLTSTVTAVKAYQKSQGISQTGNVGPLTMAALNK